MDHTVQKGCFRSLLGGSGNENVWLHCSLLNAHLLFKLIISFCCFSELYDNVMYLNTPSGPKRLSLFHFMDIIDLTIQNELYY